MYKIYAESSSVTMKYKRKGEWPMGIFSKFFVSFGANKNKYLPAPPEKNATDLSLGDIAGCSATPYKTIASFDLNLEAPKYVGAIPEATIKFYPLD